MLALIFSISPVANHKYMNAGVRIESFVSKTKFGSNFEGGDYWPAVNHYNTGYRGHCSRLKLYDKGYSSFFRISFGWRRTGHRVCVIVMLYVGDE